MFNNKVFAVILVGGKGKRLRPLSTDARPKAFLSITKDRKTMFAKTVERIKKIIQPGNIFVSGNIAHKELIKKDFPGMDRKNLLLEPVSRNTAPAITVAAAELIKRFRAAVMVVVPADQHVIDEKKYLDTIKMGIDFARDKDCLIVLGLKPTYPATGFGYVKIKVKGERSKVKDIYKVKKFTEKPNLATAKRFIADGRYFWNAGAFIFNANSVLRAVSKFAPQIFRILVQIDKKNINKLYAKFPDISIDYAIMEKADDIYCVKGTYRWLDIGSFESLKKALVRERRKFIEKGGKIIKII